MYQQTLLSDFTALGAPGPLPDVIATWGGALDLLADLTGAAPKEFGFDGTGFWPIVVTTPAFDPAHQALDGTIAVGTADPKAKTWAATAGVRDLTADEIASAYLAANPVPEVISDRQCFQQLATLGKITQDEALAAVTVGALPKVVTDGIAGLPAGQQFAAKMMLCGATEFHRSNQMTPVLGSFLGLDSAGLDAVWRAGALL